MTAIINCFRGEKKEVEKNRCVQKKIMIPESEISKCPEHEVKSNIGNILEKKKKFSKIYEIDNHIFISITKKKYKLTKIRANTHYLELTFIFLNIF